MEAPSVFPEELLNICPVVYQALHTPAVLFQSGNATQVCLLRVHRDPDWLEMQLQVNQIE